MNIFQIFTIFKNLYQEDVVKCLLKATGIELDAINIRGQTAEEVAHNRYTGQLLRSIIAGGRDIVQCTLLSSTPRAHSELLGIMKTISKKQLDKIWGKNNSNDILMAAAGKKININYCTSLSLSQR